MWSLPHFISRLKWCRINSFCLLGFKFFSWNLREIIWNHFEICFKMFSVHFVHKSCTPLSFLSYRILLWQSKKSKFLYQIYGTMSSWLNIYKFLRMYIVCLIYWISICSLVFFYEGILSRNSVFYLFLCVWHTMGA